MKRLFDDFMFLLVNSTAYVVLSIAVLLALSISTYQLHKENTLQAQQIHAMANQVQVLTVALHDTQKHELIMSSTLSELSVQLANLDDQVKAQNKLLKQIERQNSHFKHKIHELQLEIDNF